MDEVFVEQPHMHKYFYEVGCLIPNKNGSDKEKDDYELGICIAEKFREMFQYSEPLTKYISNEFVESYYNYLKKITSTAMYMEADRRNPIQYTTEHKIGDIVKKRVERINRREN